jgi:hypothetical protein
LKVKKIKEARCRRREREQTNKRDGKEIGKKGMNLLNG